MIHLWLGATLTDPACAAPALGCRQEVATGVDLLIWMMGGAAGLVGAWNLLMPLFGAGDSVNDEAATITRAGMWFRWIRRVMPTFLALLLVALILDTAHALVHGWALRRPGS
jgi:hypothetical protein